MGNDKHFNAAIHGQLARMVGCGAWDELTAYLDRLSNADFRTAGYIIGERLMPQMGNEAYWELFALLARFRPKAFLVTMLKAAPALAEKGVLSVRSPHLKTLFQQWNKYKQIIDKQKFIENILPLIDNEKDIRFLFRQLCIESPKQQLDFLLSCNTLPAQYVFFNTLKVAAHEPELLRHYCVLLIKKGDNASFNLASIVKNYFDVAGVGGTFSLNLQPHELSYLDKSFEAFCKVVRRL